MTFVKRRLDLVFQLGEGQFGESGANTVKVSGLRVLAKIVKAGGAGMGGAQLSVYGMTPAVMASLSTFGIAPTVTRKNTVQVFAGDEQSGANALIFTGTIKNGFIDYQGAPQVPFVVEAFAGALEAVKPTPFSSFPNGTKAADVMAGFAKQMNLEFENSAVTANLPISYFYGSARDQAKACAEAAGINWVIDNGKLSIWPAGQARDGDAVPIAPPDLVGYPTFLSMGVRVKTIFKPNLIYGGAIEVKSSVNQANGRWITYRLEYDLDAITPGGAWFATIDAARPGFVVVR